MRCRLAGPGGIPSARQGRPLIEETSPEKPDRWAWLAAAGLAVQVFGICLFKVFDPDTWWHLKTGEWIWTHRALPGKDIYSWVIEGKPWLTFEWLSQVLFYLAFRLGGPAGLTTLKAIVISAAFSLWLRVSRSPRIGALALGWTAVIMRAAFFDRPQIFDFTLVPAFLLLCEDEAPSARWALPLLEALWVNLHGGAALLGVAIVGLRLLRAAVWERAKVQYWAGLLCFTALAMLLSPHGWKVFPHLAATLTFPGREIISEWRPPVSLGGWLGAYMVAAAAAAAWRYREDFLLASTALAFGFMATQAVRNITFFMLSAAPLAVRSAAALWDRFGAPRLAGRRPGPAAASAATVIVLAALTGLNMRYLAAYSGDVAGFGLKEEPEGAVQYLDSRGIAGKMFNEYGMGGYLIWKCWPGRKVFIDGRNVEYGPELVLRACFWLMPKVWAGLDKEYDFDYAVTFNGRGYNCKVLDTSPRWALTYWDDSALVYLKRTQANQAVIAKDAYHYLQPNRLDYGYLDAYLADPVKTKAVLGEIDRSIASARRNTDAEQMKAYVLVSLGRKEEALRALRSAEEAFPHKPGPVLSEAWYYERTADPVLAAEAYARAAELARRDSDPISRAVALNNLGALKLREGRKGEAAEYFRQSIGLLPDYDQAKANLEKAERP